METARRDRRSMFGKVDSETVANACWTIASLLLFGLAWEAAWYVGWVNENTLPPPHIFLADLPAQAKNFEGATLVGASSLGAWFDVLAVVLSTLYRVMLGLALGFLVGLATGVAIRYCALFGTLVQPTVTLLAPVSPIAWLPVSIFILGNGDAPAIFMVFIALFFMIALGTVAQIDAVEAKYINVARIMGATRSQTYLYVILPAILPGLFVTLRLNLFGAWMVVLIAEATGVGAGLGQVINYARNSFNISMVLFVMTIIGILSFLSDYMLRVVQTKVLYWLPQQRSAAAAAPGGR